MRGFMQFYIFLELENSYKNAGLDIQNIARKLKNYSNNESEDTIIDYLIKLNLNKYNMTSILTFYF